MSSTTVELVNAPATPLPQLSSSSSITSGPGRTVASTESDQHEDISKGKTVVVISSVTCITGISSLLAGVVTVCIPAMAKDVNLESNLLLWYEPASAKSLACRGFLTCATKACFCVRPDLRVHPFALRSYGRSLWCPATLSLRMLLPISLHTRLRSRKNRNSAHYVPSFCRNCHFDVPTVCR